MLGGVAVLLLLFLGFVQQLLDITKAQQAFVFQQDQSATLLREALVCFLSVKNVSSSTVSQMQSVLLCLSFSCVTLLREALVYF